MSSFVPAQETIALGFSIAALAFSAFTSAFSRTHSKVLEATQMFYLFSFTISTNFTFFSKQLTKTWLNFIPSFLSYCKTGQIQCDSGNLITAQIVWAGLVILLMIIIKLVSIKKPNARFKPVYNFLKGVMKWMQVPLIYNATVVVITQIQAKAANRQLFSSAVVLGFYVLVAIIEVIYFKNIQVEGDNNATKWVQFAGHWRLIFMAAIIAIFTKISSSAQYALYAPIILYDIIHLTKYNFSYKVCERFFYCIMEAAFITLYTLFLFGQSYINQYNLDLFAIALIIFIQLFLILIKMHYSCKYGQANGEVNPQADEQDHKKQKNNLRNSSNMTPDLSYEELHHSSSPKNNKRR